MNVKLMVDELEIQIGWEALESLIGNLPDDDESLSEVFHRLAQSDTADVRRAVADKSVISEETVAHLATDSCPRVINTLVNSQRRKLSEPALVQIIGRNLSMVNQDVAQSVERYDQTDVTAVAKLLACSRDPAVRATLARNFGTPKIIVRELLKDPDPEVRRLAHNTLKTR